MSYPLVDLSNGTLRSWPGGCAIYADGRREECFRPAAEGERPIATVLPSGDGNIYCKYCCEESLPLTLREEVIPGRVTEMTICAQCGSGLTPSKEAS